jgi:hypothetical protein
MSDTAPSDSPIPFPGIVTPEVSGLIRMCAYTPPERGAFLPIRWEYVYR